MKIGDDVWVICDPNTGEIVTHSGNLMIHEIEHVADDLIRTLFDEDGVEKRQIAGADAPATDDSKTL